MDEKDTQFLSLKNQFLIAMPTLMDPNFHRSVTFIFEHTKEGAMGIVINQPLDIKLGDVLPQMDIEAEESSVIDMPVYLGGPVQLEKGFVIHSPLGDWESTMPVTEDIGVTTSRDIIMEIAKGRRPQRSLIALGYAGWGADQLEDEIANNVWLNGPVNPDIIFDSPDEARWESAAAILGVDTSNLSSDVGHA
jgi:putative transcriptional regulator